MQASLRRALGRGRAVVVLALDAPDEVMDRAVVVRRLRPAVDVNRRNALLLAELVRLLGPLLDLVILHRGPRGPERALLLLRQILASCQPLCSRGY